MRNLKIYRFIRCIFRISQIDLRKFRIFDVIFVEAENPDEACLIVIRRIVSAIMQESDSLTNRILCEKLKRTIRIDRIESL